jgi:cytochrome c biogenesis protein
MKHLPFAAFVAHVGSLRSTLAGLALLGVVVVAGIGGDVRIAWALAVALMLLALNLVAALVVHPVLRRKLPLLVAHAALLALVVLVGLGRLVALDGRFELTEGEAFDGTLLDAVRGPWHRDALHALRFRHEGFEIDYAPGLKRGATRNAVVWQDEHGATRRTTIGDHRPLVIEGYRLYTSPNKGFAPLLTWMPEGGEPVTGAVHLPSYPANALRQSREWPLPGGRAVWVQLVLDEALIDPASAGSFRLPARPRLVVRSGEMRAELEPGQTLSLPGGSLRFDALRTWMGYRITADATLPWLLAAALLAALALGLHYALEFATVAPREAARARAMSVPHDA